VSVRQAAPVTSSTIVVAVDVGKCSAMMSVTDAARCRVLGPIGCAVGCSALSAVVHRIEEAVGPSAQVKVGVEAAGHYHRPVLDYAWPTGWEVLELNPAHVSEQRRIAGRRRVKTDVIDLEAITELVLAGRGRPLLSRWCSVRSARGQRTAPVGWLFARRRRISCWVNSIAPFPV
jgi:transposase